MITNVNIGVDPARIQNKEPCFFVNWKEDGKQNYKFFSMRFIAEDLYQKLKKQEQN